MRRLQLEYLDKAAFGAASSTVPPRNIDDGVLTYHFHKVKRDVFAAYGFIPSREVPILKMCGWLAFAVSVPEQCEVLEVEVSERRNRNRILTLGIGDLVVRAGLPEGSGRNADKYTTNGKESKPQLIHSLVPSRPPSRQTPSPRNSPRLRAESRPCRDQSSARVRCAWPSRRCHRRP